MNPCIRSETAPLSQVIVHRPGWSHDNMHPKHIQEYFDNGECNPDYLLFDDLIDTHLAKQEHDEFTKIIKLFTGSENCKDFVSDMSNGNLLSNKILPNMIFTRDLGIVIGEKILIPWAAKHIRNPENEFAATVFNDHFTNKEIIEFHGIAPNTSLEGGDVTIYNEDLVIIGISERTTVEGIKAIESLVFDEGFNRIYAIELPKTRSMMHIDTVLTKINENEIIYFPQLFDVQMPNIYNITKGKSIDTTKPLNINLVELLNQDGYKTIGVKCGGNNELNQYREQWTDGANAFCLQPGVAIGYSRNYHTIKELEKNDYQIIKAKDFSLDKIKSKVFITFDSSELCRGRGGPRCLTLPIRRKING